MDKPGDDVRVGIFAGHRSVRKVKHGYDLVITVHFISKEATQRLSDKLAVGLDLKKEA